MNRKITVQAEHAYDVLFGSVSPEVLEPVLIGVNNIAIVVPTDLAHLAKPLTELLSALGNIDKVVVIEVPEGEAQKNFTTVNDCWAKLGAENFRRNDLVIGLGGGATTDLAGFIAATWLRGIKWIAIPTSLAGMVDAAIGGKTGINTEVGKNLVGSFYSPQLGGFIADRRILEIIESVEDFYDPQSAAIIELIERAVQVKADVVSQDLKESFLREILNYGHTLAHAVERQEKYSWRHGDAVAVGMAFIVNLAMEAGLASEALVNRHISILRRADLPTSYPREAWPQLLNYMQSDKKSRGSGLRFVAVSDENSDVYKVVRLEGLADDILARAYERISS